jgi:hypothetical protein
MKSKLREGNPIYHTYITFIYNKAELFNDRIYWWDGRSNRITPISSSAKYCDNIITKYNNTRNKI